MEMNEEQLQEIIMALVINGGNARACAIEAIRAAREDEFEKADRLIKESQEALTAAHHVQTDLIQKEAAGEKMPVVLLMVHAQDHLMNAMTVKDLAVELIEMMRKNKN